MPDHRRILLVFLGMIATGKSSLAAAFAKKRGCAYYNSDIVRKELAGLALESRQFNAIDSGIYTRDFSRRTYDTMISRATHAFEQEGKKCVVLDGSYQLRSEREHISRTLGRDCRLFFIYCHCPEAVMKKRMEMRLKNPQAISDGRWEIYLQQKKRFEMPVEILPEQFLALDTDKPLPELLRMLDGDLQIRGLNLMEEEILP